MESNEALKEEEVLETTEEGATFNHTMMLRMEPFEINDPKPRKKNGMNFTMALGIIYLILLTGAAILLEYQVQELRWQMQKSSLPNGTSGEGPFLPWLAHPVNQAQSTTKLQDLQAQLAKVQVQQERMLWQVENFTQNAELHTIKGEPGAPGIPGPQGEKGSKGDGGLMGPKGEAGAKGDKGDLGHPGIKGNMGMKGDTGVMGPPGSKGDKGDSGNPGVPGVAGSPGAKGDQGQTGVPGVPGPPGAVGPVGPKGERGSPGMAGLAGAPGRHGDPGPEGMKGSKGDTGIQGQKGTKGESGVPGSVGQKGEMGIPGTPGLRGAPGAVGQKGDTGEKGSSGQKGQKGEKGQRGEKGSSAWAVRIIGSSNRGRAEVFYDNTWGTICDDDWDNSDATVFCRMLGYSRGKALSSYGGGSGKIWLDDVACRGSEDSLWNCNTRTWGSHNCQHSEDAGVECS